MSKITYTASCASCYSAHLETKSKREAERWCTSHSAQYGHQTFITDDKKPEACGATLGLKDPHPCARPSGHEGAHYCAQGPKCCWWKNLRTAL